MNNNEILKKNRNIYEIKELVYLQIGKKKLIFLTLL